MFGSSVSLYPDGTTRPICLLNTSGKFDFKLDHPSYYSMSSGFIQEERRTYFRTVCFEMLSRSYCKGIFTADQIKTELEKSPPMFSLAIRSLFGAVGMKVISENQYIHIQKNKKKKKRNRAAIQETKAKILITKKSNPKLEDNWNASLAKVVKFKEEQGHCNVPREWERDPKMATWVQTQRQQFSFRNQDKSSAMTDERIGKLKDIGFEMTVGKGKIKGKRKMKTAKAKAKIEDSSSDEDSENDSDGESASDSDSESDDSSSPDKENA